MLPSDIIAKLHECATHNFIAARDGWFVWLSRSTKCVVFGLILELPELVYETADFARNRFDRFRYRIVLLEDRLEKAKLIAFVGWFLIVAGVAGEWYAGAKIDDLSARIQGCNEARLEEVREQSSDANARASAAYERASKNEKETASTLEQAQQERADAAKSLAAAETARKEAEDFQLEIAQANERASKNEKEAEQLRKEAEQEKLERMRLEAAVAPRSLSLEQQQQIANACRAFKGHNVQISSHATDGEAALLGGQIIASLTAAEINIADNRAAVMPVGGFDLAVHIRGPASEQKFMECLSNAFISIGHLLVGPINDPEPKAGATMSGGGLTFPAGVDFVKVVIGAKPVPMLQSPSTKSKP